MNQPPPPPLVHSVIDRKRRISLIWLIPIVAVLIGAWLIWDTYSKRGPLITVQWSSAQGLVAGQSRVRHKDVELGQVQSVALSPDLSHVSVSIRMNRMALPMLTSNAQFWVVTPRFFAGSLSGLGTLLSGSYIELDSGAPGGTSLRDFIGLKDPPLRQADVAGTTFLLRAARIGSINVGSPIFYRDLDVGQVLGWDLGNMAESVLIHAFVRAPFDQYVHQETRFWNASGVSVKLGAGGVQLQLESIKALLLGGVSFETPTTARTRNIAQADREFPLYVDQDAANRATFQRRIEMLSYFPGSVSGLAVDSAVTFQGLRVGQVMSVGLAYDPVSDSIRAPVRYEVEPERIADLQVAADRGPVENARILVQRGLRAQIKGANLLTGEMEVSLEIMPNAAPAELALEGHVIVIPAVAGGLSGITNSVTDLLAKLNRMPFEDIGRNLNDTLSGVSKIANGDEMTRALVSLQAALGSVQDLMRKLDTDAGPALRRLPEIAASLQSSVTQANRLMGSLNMAYGDNSPVNRQISRLLLQFNDTARSFKALADLLSRHPEALIRGRASTGLE
jgi:paraquat-inducible protein B